jgi:hypothetical protein
MPTHPSPYTITCLLYSVGHCFSSVSFPALGDYDLQINLAAGSRDYESGSELPTKSGFNMPVDARLQAVEGVHLATWFLEIH